MAEVLEAMELDLSPFEYLRVCNGWGTRSHGTRPITLRVPQGLHRHS